MNKIGALLGLLAETPVHPGTGQNIGSVDLPVQRERHTGLPTIPGSSLKGSLREMTPRDNRAVLFGSELGTQESFAGALVLTDCRLLALPIRCSSRLYVWVTSPSIIGRLQRDLKMIGVSMQLPLSDVNDDMVLTTEQSPLSGKLLLEDVLLSMKKDPLPAKLATLFKELTVRGESYKVLSVKLQKDLVIVSDSVMGHLAQFGLIVAARNQLEAKTKKSNNLWYAELIPSDTLFYSVVLAGDSRNTKDPMKADEILDKFSAVLNGGYVQLGANETIGAGWMSAKLSRSEIIQKILLSGGQ